MHFLRHPVIFVFVMLFWQKPVLQAQVNSNEFAAKKEIAIANLKNFAAPDTNRVNALIGVFGNATFLKEWLEVMQYLEEALRISKKINYTKGLASCYYAAGNRYKSASDYNRALSYYDSVMYLTMNSQDKRLEHLRSKSYERTGHIYYTQENYYTALDYFFEALKYSESNNRFDAIRINDFIVKIYTSLNKLDVAMEFAEKNLALLHYDTERVLHTDIYLAIIEICLVKKDLIMANLYLDKIAAFLPNPKQVQVSFGYYLRRGQVSLLQHNYKAAYTHFQRAYNYAVAGGHKNSIYAALRELSSTALLAGKMEDAKKYAILNLDMAEGMITKTTKVEALTNLANYYYKAGDKNNAFILMNKAMQLKDSLVNEMRIKQVNVLGAIYEAERQRKQIVLLQNEKEKHAADVERQSMLNKVFIGSIAALLFFGYLGYINFKKGQQLARQQQTLQKQKIIELERNKQLITIDAVMKGQEEERNRIAKDLHDGLGGLLSGTKLSFLNIKEKLVLSSEHSVLFEKSLSMLDNTIGDLRKVAQNLLPEALVKFGLGEAVRDFCDSIKYSTNVEIICQQFGEKRELESTMEVFIFRIIQELVNNAIKHARAHRIIVQLNMNKNNIGITVEDNGLGFDIAILSTTQGSGISNINYRVQYFNGTIDIVTSPGYGTSVNIDLKA